MPFKPHLKLNTDSQKEKPIKLKFNYGFPDKKPVDDETKNYHPMASSFRQFLYKFNKDLDARVSIRNPNIEVPLHIEYIEILFYSQFVISDFYSKWFNEFGLLGINFSKFNNEVLFAITDRKKFSTFIKSIEGFIEKETKGDKLADYSTLILYVKEFKLLTAKDIIKFQNLGSLMNFRLIDDFALGKGRFKKILDSLFTYLESSDIEYNYDKESHNIEIKNISEVSLKEVVNNFDIVMNVTSSLATVITPNEFNLPERSYGFVIKNSEEELPIIGILDTGISDETPLNSIIIDDDEYNLTGTSVFSDTVNHGTAIAALAAFGKKAYLNEYRGEIQSDAHLLSIKIMDAASSYLSQKAVLDVLKKAKSDYPTIKIFVLTICYEGHKLNNEEYSTYAYELDKFSNDNDCLIAICTANNEHAISANTKYDLNYFNSECTNLCTPSESMNNITVGAAAHSLRTGNFEGISTGKEFPSLFSRKSHIDLHSIFSKTKINHRYFKPDVIECGGDYEYNSSKTYIGSGLKASMQVLSADPSESFYNQIGTSFSAPLVANVAAQILKIYPLIRAQSIKALIINGACLDFIRFPKLHDKLLNKTAGHGLVDEIKSVYSNDNQITFLVEDQIEHEELKIFPINFPKYLIKDKLGKQNGILKVTATLCFSFNPVQSNQLAYCPIHIAFGFFKNQNGNEIQATDDNIKSKIKGNLGWSQNGRYKSKPVPYTNTQKISFPVNVEDLVNESGTFKLAVQCRINPQLLPGVESQYKKPHLFSLVITVEETLVKKMLTGKLYQEMSLSNEIENIIAADLDLEGDALI